MPKMVVIWGFIIADVPNSIIEFLKFIWVNRVFAYFLTASLILFVANKE